jgi:hypothetical protein
MPINQGFAGFATIRKTVISRIVDKRQGVQMPDTGIGKIIAGGSNISYCVFFCGSFTDHVTHSLGIDTHPLPHPRGMDHPSPFSRYHMSTRKFYKFLRFRRLSDSPGDTPE